VEVILGITIDLRSKEYYWCIGGIHNPTDDRVAKMLTPSRLCTYMPLIDALRSAVLGTAIRGSDERVGHPPLFEVIPTASGRSVDHK